MHSCVHGSIIQGDQDMNTTKVSLNRWLGKEDMIHIYNEILLSHQKRWNTATYDSMDGASEYHAKENTLERESQGPYAVTHIGI